MTRNTGVGALCATALVLVGWSAYSWLAARPPAPVTGNDVTYFCTETREVVEGPVQDVPAVNPKTGRRTLVRAVYSNKTKEWIPMPSDEVLRRNRQALAQDDGQSPLAFEPPEEPEDDSDSEGDESVK
jgi:hypothetical protein